MGRPSPRDAARIVTAVVALSLVGCDSTRPTPTPSAVPGALGSTPAAAGSTGPSAASASPAAPASAPSGPFRPSFATTPCPDDVTTQLVLQSTCGYLTVLEDRSKPAGRTIQVFVIRIDPPGGTTTPDPLLVLDAFGNVSQYGSTANAGQRTHRVAYLVDLRGIGHSRPALDCPEVEAIGPALAGLRLSDPARRTALDAAVGACHDRLTGQGIDLAAYDIAADAADLDDLRTALGIDRWDVLGFGGTNRILVELARSHASTIRAAMIDSPSVPYPNTLEAGIAATDAALARLVALCAGQAACARALPDFAAMIPRALATLDAQPLQLDVTGTIAAIRIGHPIHVVIDGAALLRWFRARLGANGGADAHAIGSTVQAVLDGRVRATDAIAVDLASDVDDCLGILTTCEQVVAGSVYSVVCRGEDPTSTLAMAGMIAQRPVWQELFRPSPTELACDRWAVPPAAPAPRGSNTGGVPTLVMHGVLDPYSATLDDIRAGDPHDPTLFTLEVPNQSYNVLGYNECPRAIRNAWIDAPTAAPADTSCLAGIPTIEVAPR